VTVTGGRLTWSEPQGSYVKPCFIEAKSSKAIVRAVKPEPKDGSMLADTWVSLSRTPGEAAVSHAVNYGNLRTKYSVLDRVPSSTTNVALDSPMTLMTSMPAF